MSKGIVLAVVGGQYGSEGKGVIVNKIANDFDVHVRVGGPNAGHSINYQGDVWKMQQLPCGWTNPNAELVIGPGAVVSLDRLIAEVEAIDEKYPALNVKSRVIVASQAAVLEDYHHQQEGGVDGYLHQRIGSTGEGVGAVRLARIERDPYRVRLVGQVDALPNWLQVVSDVPERLAQATRMGDNVLLEGTQGSGLSLIHGPWPFVTSADTNAAQMAADAGIPPQHVTDVILVVRSHPIRVAGNSGPLKGETTWERISERLGRDVIERTTVTNKVRRVGEWDEELVKRAVTLNAPNSFALTFADYINPADEGKTRMIDLSEETLGFIDYLESFYEVPVSMVGTGGKERWEVIDRGIAY